MPESPSPLPYTDTKPVGAADFYMAINATFRFVLKRFGMEGLQRYWTDMGSTYQAPVSQRWRDGGLPAVAAHWRAFFTAEPGAEVNVTEDDNAVRVEVQTCPAIKHLCENGRTVLPEFCQHCYFMSEAMAAPAGFTVRVCGGNGRCTQTFQREGTVPAQDLNAITPC